MDKPCSECGTTECTWVVSTAGEYCRCACGGTRLNTTDPPHSAATLVSAHRLIDRLRIRLAAETQRREQAECRVAEFRDCARRINLRIGAIRRAAQAELDRGYVLTDEPNAGPAWRRRWIEIISATDSTMSVLAPLLEEG